MSTILFLIGFPLLVAIVLLVLKEDRARDVVVKVSAAVIAAASIYLVATNVSSGGEYFAVPKAETIGNVMMAIEVCLALVIIVLGIQKKRYLAPVLSIIQTPLMIWFELKQGHHIDVQYPMYVDHLGMIMVLIVGIVGSLIAVFATGYMKDFQAHAKGKDRRPWFFFLIFLFLSAMFGLVMSNNLIWMYFFWEITSLVSFFMIGYNGLFHKEEEEDKIATRNAFRALVMNLGGGLGFAIGIVLLGSNFDTLELSNMILLGKMGQPVFIVAMFLAFAGITKCAQMPFNSWLLGAMVAPTPVSALLHSSTMVKAGVFLILKLAPVLGGNLAGTMVYLVGGITFLLASFAAISQSNAKRVLAYSTVANLGLIVTCGGIGTPAAVWAGTLLIIFHAITKSLLFLCVGTAEHHIGSRDIEDMDGLFDRMPKLAACMLIGIAGMFLAPFGMLISKWATMVTFVDAGNPLLILIICFGSAATAFYWSKWMGKLAAIVANRENIEKTVHGAESFVHVTLTALVVLVCICFPFISKTMIVPYLSGTAVFGQAIDTLPLQNSNMMVMVIMVAVLVLLFAFFFGRTKKRIVPIYMAGVNQGDDLTFEDAMFQPKPVSLRNWYMESYFGEFKMNVIGVATTSVIILGFIGMVVGALIGYGGM
ncbi:MAG: NADH-quinone oxidoreductase subunit L [Clostridiales bacterium]|nr:NADH-quinone oxidoreductase subunit L [Clostridiales bacterium]